MDIVIASTIAALLFAAGFRKAGFNWRSAALFAAISAAGLGVSAAHYLDRF